MFGIFSACSLFSVQGFVEHRHHHHMRRLCCRLLNSTQMSPFMQNQNRCVHREFRIMHRRSWHRYHVLSLYLVPGFFSFFFWLSKKKAQNLMKQDIEAGQYAMISDEKRVYGIWKCICKWAVVGWIPTGIHSGPPSIWQLLFVELNGPLPLDLSANSTQCTCIVIAHILRAK